MASTQPLKNKAGEIYAYQIQVYRGRESSGKKLKPYSMVWEIPAGWKSENKIKKGLAVAAAEFEAKCKSGAVPVEKKTFEQYAEYVLDLRDRDKKHRTVFRYRQLLERILPEIGHLKLSEITPEHLNALYLKMGQKGQNKRTGGGLAPQTILHHHRFIHSVLAQAVKEGHLQNNVCDRATPPEVPKHEAEFFELEEVLAISKALQEAPIKWQAIVNLLVDTGARRGEIAGLKWKSVDFKNNEIIIENNLQYTSERGLYDETPKNGEDRIISIAPEVMALLKRYRKEQAKERLQLGTYWKETGYCFTRNDGLPMHVDSINNWLREFSQVNGLPHIHPHKFRHTQASLLYAVNIDPVTISKRLGHSEVSTTQNIYAHLMKGSDRKASQAIEDILYKKA